MRDAAPIQCVYNRADQYLIQLTRQILKKNNKASLPDLHIEIEFVVCLSWGINVTNAFIAFSRTRTPGRETIVPLKYWPNNICFKIGLQIEYKLTYKIKYVTSTKSNWSQAHFTHQQETYIKMCAYTRKSVLCWLPSEVNLFLWDFSFSHSSSLSQYLLGMLAKL